MCVPQSLDPICGKFDKFLAHGQAHMGQMGIWLWQCTPTGLDNSTELRMEKIPQAVTEIWVPQVWQPPARPPARTVTTIPLQPGGLRGKKVWQTDGRTSFSMNKPTTWCKSGRVRLVSSSCLYKTQPERALAQVCHTTSRIDALSPDEYQFHLLLHRNSHHSQATYPKWLNH